MNSDQSKSYRDKRGFPFGLTFLTVVLALVSALFLAGAGCSGTYSFIYPLAFMR